MSIKVLIVEDDFEKYGRIAQALVNYGLSSDEITHKLNSADALGALRQNAFDLMLLDVNIPRRTGESPRRGEGIELLRGISRDEDCRKPTYVVGVTAFEDVLEEFGEEFDQNLWSLIHYAVSSDRWVSQLTLKVDYIRAVKSSRNFSDGVTFGTDIAIITALDTVEFTAVRALPCGWQPLRFPYDETRYWSGNIQEGNRNISVVTASAPRMGMPSSAVLASKVVHQFRPRLMVMLGLCAGRAEKVNLGDVIVADPTWDWGSGKITSENDQPKFDPAPHQLDLDGSLISAMKDIAEDPVALARIKQAASGRKPSSELRVHFGPLVSGAAVVAYKPTFDALLEQHRGILGLDMEAYAIATASLGSGRPRPYSLIIKGVCDFADKQKSDDYQEYAASVSAAFFFANSVKLLDAIAFR